MDELDDIIDLLNHENLPTHSDKKKPKPKNQGEQVEPLQIQVQLQDLPDFSEIYSKRLEKMEKKNESKQEQFDKKKKLQEQLNKMKEEKEGPVIKGDISQVGVRYLIFKNWSGNHLDIVLCDNGYKYRFTNGVINLVKYTLEQNGFVEGYGQEGLIIWNNGVINSSIYQSLGAYQKINHFPKTFQITRKDLMLQNLSKMKNKFPRQYNFFPQTFILPNQTGMFKDHCEKVKEDRWYIIKPHNSSQGKGIWISNSLQEILQKQKQCIVVSEYIHRPLLAKGLKFDLRIYVGITCWNPLRIYMYQEGLTRLATSPYSFDISSKDNVYAHLTNYSLNKNADNFEANDDQDQSKGHKWSHFALREYLKEQGYDLNLIWSRIDDLVVKSILSIENTVFNAIEMNVPYRTNCFEVLGFDILIDDSFRPWLLEINLSPSLNTDSPLDLKIKGGMIADLFTMMGVVPPDQQFGVEKNHLLNHNRMSPKEMKNDYSKLQRLVLKETQEEQKRSGGWRKIYPTQTASKYKPFFDIDRPFNRLLRDEEAKKFKANNVGSPNFNQAMRGLGDRKKE